MGSTGLRLNSSTPPHPTEVAEAEKAAEEKAKGLKDPVKFEKYHDMRAPEGLKDPVKFEKYHDMRAPEVPDGATRELLRRAGAGPTTHDGLGELGAVLYAIGCGRQLEPGQAVTQATQGATDMSPEDALKKDEKDQDSVVAQFKQQCQKTTKDQK
eukprot:g10388.t1